MLVKGMDLSMKKRYKIVAGIILVLAVGIFSINIYAKNTTFKVVVSDHLSTKDISSIEIDRLSDTINEDQINVTDPSQIELIMKSFSQAKLRETSFSNINFKESLWITIKTNGNRQFGITLYDKNYIQIFKYNAQKNADISYEITNGFDPSVIQGLFK